MHIQTSRESLQSTIRLPIYCWVFEIWGNFWVRNRIWLAIDWLMWCLMILQTLLIRIGVVYTGTWSQGAILFLSSLQRFERSLSEKCRM